jgi:hypothetical protein
MTTLVHNNNQLLSPLPRRRGVQISFLDIPHLSGRTNRDRSIRDDLKSDIQTSDDVCPESKLVNIFYFEKELNEPIQEPELDTDKWERTIPESILPPRESHFKYTDLFDGSEYDPADGNGVLWFEDLIREFNKIDYTIEPYVDDSESMFWHAGSTYDGDTLHCYYEKMPNETAIEFAKRLCTNPMSEFVFMQLISNLVHYDKIKKFAFINKAHRLAAQRVKTDPYMYHLVQIENKFYISEFHNVGKWFYRTGPSSVYYVGLDRDHKLRALTLEEWAGL